MAHISVYNRAPAYKGYPNPELYASPPFDPRDHIPEELYFLGPQCLLVIRNLLEIV